MNRRGSAFSARVWRQSMLYVEPNDEPGSSVETEVRVDRVRRSICTLGEHVNRIGEDDCSFRVEEPQKILAIKMVRPFETE
jgi:hypothetical protein